MAPTRLHTYTRTQRAEMGVEVEMAVQNWREIEGIRIWRDRVGSGLKASSLSILTFLRW